MADAPEIPVEFQRANTLLGKLLKDSALGPAVRKAAKEAFPDAGLEFAEDRFDAQLDPLREALAATQKQLEESNAAREADRKEREDAALQQSMQQKLDHAIQKYSLTADGAQKAVDRMKETGNVSDFEAAAAWVAGQTPRAAATNGTYLGPQNINLFGTNQADERYALLHKDPMGGFLDAEFRELAADPDAYCRSAGF